MSDEMTPAAKSQVKGVNRLMFGRPSPPVSTVADKDAGGLGTAQPGQVRTRTPTPYPNKRQQYTSDMELLKCGLTKRHRGKHKFKRE